MDGNVITISKRNEAIAQIDMLLYGLNKIDLDNLTDIGRKYYEEAKKQKEPENYLSLTKKDLIEKPITEIVVAFMPSRNEEREILENVKTNISENTVVDIQINSFLIGGAQVTFNGKYYDGSLVKKIKNNV